MHTQEIREICVPCGNRRTRGVDGHPVDWCKAAGEECAKIVTCDPSMRIPKKKPLHDCFITEEPIEGVDQG